MQLTDFARKVPDEVWALFEPILPPVVWGGKGRPPYDNRACLPAVLYGLVTGSDGAGCPPAFPLIRPCNGASRSGWNRRLFGMPGNSWPSSMIPCRGSTGMRWWWMAPRNLQKKGGANGAQPCGSRHRRDGAPSRL